MKKNYRQIDTLSELLLDNIVAGSVLMAMTRLADENIIYANMSELESELKMSKPTIKKHINYLKEINWIKPIKAKQNKINYKLNKNYIFLSNSNNEKVINFRDRNDSPLKYLNFDAMFCRNTRDNNVKTLH